MNPQIESAIAALDRIDYDHPHRVDTGDLPCDLSPAECQAKGKEYAAAVRHSEALEQELAAELKRRKGEIEVARGEMSRLLKIIETGREERPTKVMELWCKRNGEVGLVAVRRDKFIDVVDADCYVGFRFPQTMDLQRKIPGTGAAAAAKASTSGPSEEALHRQADAAFAPPSSDEPLPFDGEEGDEDERSVIPMEGAAEPEVKGEAKRSRKERAASTAAKAPKPAAKDKPKAKAKAK